MQTREPGPLLLRLSGLKTACSTTRHTACLIHCFLHCRSPNLNRPLTIQQSFERWKWINARTCTSCALKQFHYSARGALPEFRMRGANAGDHKKHQELPTLCAICAYVNVATGQIVRTRTNRFYKLRGNARKRTSCTTKRAARENRWISKLKWRTHRPLTNPWGADRRSELYLESAFTRFVRRDTLRAAARL